MALKTSYCQVFPKTQCGGGRVGYARPALQRPLSLFGEGGRFWPIHRSLGIHRRNSGSDLRSGMKFHAFPDGAERTVQSSAIVLVSAVGMAAGAGWVGVGCGRDVHRDHPLSNRLLLPISHIPDRVSRRWPEPFWREIRRSSPVAPNDRGGDGANPQEIFAIVYRGVYVHLGKQLGTGTYPPRLKILPAALTACAAVKSTGIPSAGREPHESSSDSLHDHHDK